MGNVNGIEYADERLGILFVCMAILANIRIPQLTIVTAAGHYKETQNHAICEALINIVTSVRNQLLQGTDRSCHLPEHLPDLTMLHPDCSDMRCHRLV